MKYQEILNKGSQILRANNIKSSNLDCELILSKVLNKTREEILINLNNFLILLVIGGCAGSTTCGIKIFRFQILVHFVLNQIKKLVYPHGIFSIKYNNEKISITFIYSIITFIFLYFFIFFILAAILSVNGLDFITAISGSASAISNVGPGLGDIIGPNGNFSDLPNFSKLSLSLGMLLGRLELFAVLVLFFPSFWKN